MDQLEALDEDDSTSLVATGIAFRQLLRLRSAVVALVHGGCGVLSPRGIPCSAFRRVCVHVFVCGSCVLTLSFYCHVLYWDVFSGLALFSQPCS